MFSPEGYTSVKAIIDKFNLTWDWDDLNLDSLFKFVFEEDDGALSARLAAQFSKAEVFERAVIHLLNGCQLYMCSPDGGTFRLDANIFDNRVHYLYLEDDPLFDTKYFECVYDWPTAKKIITDNLDLGRDPWKESFDQIGFTSINLFYDRQNYLVHCKNYRDIQGYYLIELSCFGQPLEIEAIEGFANQSLCIKCADAEFLNLEKLRESIFKIVFDAALGPGSFDECIPQKEARPSKVGRPSVKQDAAQAFLKHFEIDNHPPWKEVVNVLQEKEGIDVSDRSIKRGLHQINLDKTKTK